MKVFVAGATGVLGRRIVPGLIAEGHGVVGLSRSAANDDLLKRFGAEPRPGDIFDRDQMTRLSADCDAVFHFATAIPVRPRPNRRDWTLNDRIRREGTSSLIAAAVTNRCRLFLQESITLLYGDRRGDRTDESAEIPVRLPGILTSAARMEKLVLGAAARERLPAVILRFGTLYSHDSPQTASIFRGIRSGRLPVIGKGKAYWNMINSDDAAAAAVGTAGVTDLPPGSVFNICDDEPVTSRDLFDFIAESLGSRRPGSVPAVFAKLALGSDLTRILRSSARCTNAAAKNALGWTPKYPTYREGIRAELGKWPEGERGSPGGGSRPADRSTPR
jgi:nucleoside-diphosphate-sugar epimerase